MKADKETEMFRVLTGSRLYGTFTEKSDYDYKAVVLPALSDLLLGKKISNRKERPEGLKPGDKMLENEAETEYLPLQVFLDDFFSGQTYALEIAFAVVNGQVEFADFSPSHFVKLKFTELVNTFLTNNVKKMVGYAIAQSQIYGLKTERFTSLKKVVETLTEHVAMFGSDTTISSEQTLQQNLLKLKHVKMVQIENAQGGSALAPALDVVGKKFPLTNKVSTMLYSLNGLLAGYGNRVAAFEGEGVDWKALSHALRITEQVLELSRTGKLVFPRPNAPYLAAAKSGELPLEEVMKNLNDAFSQVDEAVEQSVLQARTPELEKAFTTWKIDFLNDMYTDQMRDIVAVGLRN